MFKKVWKAHHLDLESVDYYKGQLFAQQIHEVFSQHPHLYDYCKVSGTWGMENQPVIKIFFQCEMLESEYIETILLNSGIDYCILKMGWMTCKIYGYGPDVHLDEIVKMLKLNP